MNDTERIPLAPFQDWLKSRLPHYDSTTQMAETIGVTPRKLEGYLTGMSPDKRAKKKHIDYVKIDVVDKALVMDGSTDLWEVCPWLYE